MTARATFLRRFVAQKLKSNQGESLAEILIAMLVACMATVALVAMTLSASSTAQKTREAYQDVCDQEAAVAFSTPSTSGSQGAATVTPTNGSATVTLGGLSDSLSTHVYTTDDFVYYEVAATEKTTSSQSTQGGGA